MGIIDGEPRSAITAAASPASVCFVPAEPFLDVLEQVPLVSIRLLALLSWGPRAANRSSWSRRMVRCRIPRNRLVAEHPGGWLAALCGR